MVSFKKWGTMVIQEPWFDASSVNMPLFAYFFFLGHLSLTGMWFGPAPKMDAKKTHI